MRANSPSWAGTSQHRIVYWNIHHYQFVSQSTKILITFIHSYELTSKCTCFIGSLLPGEPKYRCTIEEYDEACPWSPYELTSYKWCINIGPHYGLFSQLHWCIQRLGPVGSNHGSLARARARGTGSHTDRRTTTTSPRALSDPDDEGHGVGRGGGGQGRRPASVATRTAGASGGRMPTKLLSRS